MLSPIDRSSKKNTKPVYEKLFFNPHIMAIVLSYSHEYMYRMKLFCDYHHLNECSKTIQNIYDTNAGDLAQSMKALLDKENETALIVAEAQASVQIRIVAMQEENQRLLDNTKTENRSIVQPRMAVLKMEIAAIEEELREKQVEVEKAAELALEENLKKAQETGFIATAIEIQKKAKIALEDTRKELAESEPLFEEISRMAILLEDFPMAMDREIAGKKKWNNRFKRVKMEELDAMFWHTTTTNQRIFKCVLMGFVILLGGILLGTLAIFPLLMPILAFGFFSASIGGTIGAIIAVSYVVDQFIAQFEYGNEERFEGHTLNSVISSDLLVQFKEIKNKITFFQQVNVAINKTEEQKKQYPLLALDENKATVGEIRTAMVTEMSFFKRLHDTYQEPLIQREEKSMAMD